MSRSALRRWLWQLKALALGILAARLRERPLVETASRLRDWSRRFSRRTDGADLTWIAGAARCAANATRWLARLRLGPDNQLTRLLITWALLEPSGQAVLHVGVRVPRDSRSAQDPLEDRAWITLVGAAAAGDLGLGDAENCRELWSSRDL